MIRPRALCPGDRIAIVAPASNCPRDEFDRGVDEVRRLGYEPVFSPAVFEPLVSELAASRGFEVDIGHFAVFGQCRACSPPDPAADPSGTGPAREHPHPQAPSP